MKKKHSITFVPFRRWIIFLLAAAVCLPAGPVQSTETIHVGFSRSIVGEINENDTMAAVKLWSTKLMLTDDISANVQPKIYDDVSEIETDLKERVLDLINLNASEFFDLQHLLDHEQFIIADYGGSITVEYLLLVRRKSRIADIKDLRGCVLRFPTNARNSLSTIWLDVKLAEAGLPTTEHFFDQMVSTNKINTAVLPVFFGKADACLVTRKGFDTMVELNPQISHQLRILAASKGYIPGFLGFSKSYKSRTKSAIENNIRKWDQTAAGFQFLIMFQMDDFVFQPFDVLGPTMELIKKHRRLSGSDTGTSLPESKAKSENF
nr:PhnD/SsuA/transferrin family substrate-binding protein [uncultured Desulfobacter sp.]